MEGEVRSLPPESRALRIELNVLQIKVQPPADVRGCVPTDRSPGLECPAEDWYGLCEMLEGVAMWHWRHLQSPSARWQNPKNARLICDAEKRFKEINTHNIYTKQNVKTKHPEFLQRCGSDREAGNVCLSQFYKRHKCVWTPINACRFLQLICFVRVSQQITR